MTIQDAAIIFTFLSTVVIGIRSIRNQDAKGDSDISAAWKELIAPMQLRIASLELQVAENEKVIAAHEAARKADAIVIKQLCAKLSRQALKLNSMRLLFGKLNVDVSMFSDDMDDDKTDD